MSWTREPRYGQLTRNALFALSYHGRTYTGSRIGTRTSGVPASSNPEISSPRLDHFVITDSVDPNRPSSPATSASAFRYVLSAASTPGPNS